MTIISTPGELDWKDAPLPDPLGLFGKAEILVWISTVKGPIVKTVVPGSDKKEWLDHVGNSTAACLDGTVRWWAWLRKP